MLGPFDEGLDKREPSSNLANDGKVICPCLHEGGIDLGLCEKGLDLLPVDSQRISRLGSRQHVPEG